MLFFGLMLFEYIFDYECGIDDEFVDVCYREVDGEEFGVEEWLYCGYFLDDVYVIGDVGVLFECVEWVFVFL